MKKIKNNKIFVDFTWHYKQLDVHTINWNLKKYFPAINTAGDSRQRSIMIVQKI